MVRYKIISSSEKYRISVALNQLPKRGGRCQSFSAYEERLGLRVAETLGELSNVFSEAVVVNLSGEGHTFKGKDISRIELRQYLKMSNYDSFFDLLTVFEDGSLYSVCDVKEIGFKEFSKAFPAKYLERYVPERWRKDSFSYSTFFWNQFSLDKDSFINLATDLMRLQEGIVDESKPACEAEKSKGKLSSHNCTKRKPAKHEKYLDLMKNFSSYLGTNEKLPFMSKPERSLLKRIRAQWQRYFSEDTIDGKSIDFCIERLKYRSKKHCSNRERYDALDRALMRLLHENIEPSATSGTVLMEMAMGKGGLTHKVSEKYPDLPLYAFEPNEDAYRGALKEFEISEKSFLKHFCTDSSAFDSKRNVHLMKGYMSDFMTEFLDQTKEKTHLRKVIIFESGSPLHATITDGETSLQFKRDLEALIDQLNKMRIEVVLVGMGLTCPIFSAQDWEGVTLSTWSKETKGPMIYRRYAPKIRSKFRSVTLC